MLWHVLIYCAEDSHFSCDLTLTQVRKAKPLHMGDRWVTDSPKWVENKKEDTGVAHVSS